MSRRRMTSGHRDAAILEWERVGTASVLRIRVRISMKYASDIYFSFVEEICSGVDVIKREITF